jgi:hypothetical protein
VHCCCACAGPPLGEPCCADRPPGPKLPVSKVKVVLGGIKTTWHAEMRAGLQSVGRDSAGQPKRDHVGRPRLSERQKATKTATWSVIGRACWYYDRHACSQHARIVWEQWAAFLSQMPPCCVCSLTRNHEHTKIRPATPWDHLLSPMQAVVASVDTDSTRLTSSDRTCHCVLV